MCVIIIIHEQREHVHSSRNQIILEHQNYQNMTTIILLDSFNKIYNSQVCFSLIVSHYVI
jgi:hypothetical protein